MFSTLIVCYLFLGGAGAGACLVSVLIGLLSPGELVACHVSRRKGGFRCILCAPDSYRRLVSGGFVVALITLVVAVTCLASDLGRIDRLVVLLAHPTASYIAVGSYALIACMVLTGLLAWVWGGLGQLGLTAVRVLEAVAAVIAIVVMVYTGLLLQSLPSVPLWATPWLPVLFVLSSISCGVALLLGMTQINGTAVLFSDALRRLAAVDAVIIVLEALAVAIFALTLSSAGGLLEAGGVTHNPTTGAVSDSLTSLLAGSLAPLFWGGFIVMGLVVPFVLDVALARSQQPLPMVALATVVCVLAGGFILRFCMVEAGLHPALALPGMG